MGSARRKPAADPKEERALCCGLCGAAPGSVTGLLMAPRSVASDYGLLTVAGGIIVSTQTSEVS